METFEVVSKPSGRFWDYVVISWSANGFQTGKHPASFLLNKEQRIFSRLTVSVKPVILKGKCVVLLSNWFWPEAGKAAPGSRVINGRVVAQLALADPCSLAFWVMSCSSANSAGISTECSDWSCFSITAGYRFRNRPTRRWERARTYLLFWCQSLNVMQWMVDYYVNHHNTRKPLLLILFSISFPRSAPRTTKLQYAWSRIWETLDPNWYLPLPIQTKNDFDVT